MILIRWKDREYAFMEENIAFVERTLAKRPDHAGPTDATYPKEICVRTAGHPQITTFDEDGGDLDKLWGTFLSALGRGGVVTKFSGDKGKEDA